ncbi:cytochrome P450 6B6-like [Maniola jurtina]|uniref:cytochrome P450 6B6-like n=1 Tax=Maniola jurtina TaxID=191418 RepID=UPI001E68B166|nr:cytochrome P450 6B6-like [Maniola jurtina]
MIALALLAAALVAAYLFGTRNFSYWRRRGVKHDRPLPFFGTNARNYLLRKSFTELATEAYRKYPRERVVGFFRANRPELVLRDPELARRVLVADFASFYPRGLTTQGRAPEPLLRNLFFADGDLWRLLRQRMTPTFTSGKLRAMFPLIVERAERLQARALAAAAAGRELDARDLMARYTTDFIGACGFGLDSDSLGDDDSAFRRLGAKIFQLGAKEMFVVMLRDMFPLLFANLSALGRVEADFFRLVDEVLRRRDHRPSGRHDFVDSLLECKQRGTMEVESIERRRADGSPERASLEMDDTIVAAQVFVFFAAGFETSSSATSMTLHELAHHPRVQRKAQAEVDAVLARHGGRLSYDAVKEMTYLEWTLKEGMRVFPSLGFLIRECARRYTFEGLGLTIDPGVRVVVPLQALHNDPQYFERPHEFRPERHDPARLDPAHKHVYMPFGDGPRACIGARLGLMQSLAGLAAVLARFSVRPAPGAPRRPAVNPASGIVQSVAGGLPLLFELRDAAAAPHS